MIDDFRQLSSWQCQGYSTSGSKAMRVSPSSDPISLRYPFKRALAAVELNGASLHRSLVSEPLPYNVLFPEQDRSLFVGFV